MIEQTYEKLKSLRLFSLAKALRRRWKAPNTRRCLSRSCSVFW